MLRERAAGSLESPINIKALDACDLDLAAPPAAGAEYDPLCVLLSDKPALYQQLQKQSLLMLEYNERHTVQPVNVDLQDKHSPRASLGPPPSGKLVS